MYLLSFVYFLSLFPFVLVFICFIFPIIFIVYFVLIVFNFPRSRFYLYIYILLYFCLSLIVSFVFEDKPSKAKFCLAEVLY